MIRRIELTNYMCHSQTVIEPAAGLTVLAGPNNCGKSAVVVALRTLCENIRSDFMVKHGESDCRVRVETNDGHKLEWRRKNGTVSYVIDNREVHRLQGSVPDDLHELLRLPKVNSPKDGDTYDVHFARQKSPIFLLDQPGGHAARFFASSSDAALLMKMQDKHKENVREKKGERALLTQQAETLGSLLEHLKPAESIDNTLQEVEKEYEKLRARSEHIQKLGSDVGVLSDQTDRVEHIYSRVNILQDLAAPPKLMDTGPLDTLIEALSEQIDRVEHIYGRVNILQDLASPPKLMDTGPLDILIEDLADAQAIVSQEEKKQEVLADLSQPPELHYVEPLEKLCDGLRDQLRELNRFDEQVECYQALTEPPHIEETQPLEKLHTRLKEAQRNVSQCEARINAFDVLEEPPTLEDTEALSDLVDDIVKASKTMEGHQSDVESTEEELRVFEKQIRQWAEDHPICPTCGAKVDPDRLVDAGGMHNHAEE